VSIELGAAGLVGLTRDSFTALKTALWRDAGANAPGWLQEAGYAGGHALHVAFTQWCGSQALTVPESMSAPEFGERATQFLSEMGWGAVAVGTLHDSVVTVDSHDWVEADPASAMQFPGCYLSAGLLADFFGRVGNAPLAAMEVECRSMGHERCRFLLGSAETMQHVYDGMAQGVDYDAALAGMA
jgi:predicted hydrocarbon binding protein